MEQVLHRGIRAGVAAAVAGAGLLAVTPAAPPQLDLREVAVQLTSVDAADLFTALGTNLHGAATNLSAGVTDLFQLHLADAVASFANVDGNLIAIPENIELAAVGGLLGQDFEAYVSYTAGSLDWSQFFTGVLSLPGNILQAAWTAVEDLFHGQLANALLEDFAIGNALLLGLPELFVFGLPALVDDSLLSLVGL
ncbi:MAG TPA: hypothetical protein VFQ37_05375 [Mycobacterium sp.]|nr:hypothetical protein [Mycobacterium sp.]